MLISWSTQKRLGILPPGWPWEDYSKRGGVNFDHMDISRSSRVQKMEAEKQWPPKEWPMKLQKICEKFADILVDELKAIKRLKVPDMEVRLKAGTTSYICTRARPVSVH